MKVFGFLIKTYIARGEEGNVYTYTYSELAQHLLVLRK